MPGALGSLVDRWVREAEQGSPDAEEELADPHTGLSRRGAPPTRSRAQGTHAPHRSDSTQGRGTEDAGPSLSPHSPQGLSVCPCGADSMPQA